MSTVDYVPGFDNNRGGTPLPARGALYGMLGILGVVCLGISFAINQGPPPGLAGDELRTFAVTNFRTVMLAGWLQSIGPALIAAFVFGVMSWLPRGDGFLQSMTQFGMATLMLVSLLEVTLYFAALYSSPLDMAEMSIHLISAVQHLYFMIAAPAVFLPFGLVLVRLHFRRLGWSAVGMGSLFGVLGAVTVFNQVLPNAVTMLGAVQAAWWLTAAITIACVRPTRTA